LKRVVKGKGKVVPVHIMKLYVGSRGIVQHVLNLDVRRNWVVRITPRQQSSRERISVLT